MYSGTTTPNKIRSEHNNIRSVPFIWRGGARLLLAWLELFYLIGVEKPRRVILGDLSLIFFCILDEAATDEEGTKDCGKIRLWRNKK